MSKPAVPVAALVTRLAILGFGLALFFDQAGARHLLRLDESANGAMIWVSLLAPAFFLWALWAASGVFVRINNGDAFGSAVVKGLHAAGAGLMLGAFCAIVVQPSLIFLIGNGFSEMRGVKFDLDVENFTLALVGLVLILLARQGQKLKSTLEEFV